MNRRISSTTGVGASRSNLPSKQLSRESQIGNTFIFLFAGQGMFSFIFMGPNIQYCVETTASSLAVAVGYMAIHDDIQEEVVEQIMSVLGADRMSSIHDKHPMIPGLQRLSRARQSPRHLLRGHTYDPWVLPKHILYYRLEFSFKLLATP
jgi:hypothetical protein